MIDAIRNARKEAWDARTEAWVQFPVIVLNQALWNSGAFFFVAASGGRVWAFIVWSILSLAGCALIWGLHSTQPVFGTNENETVRTPARAVLLMLIQWGTVVSAWCYFNA